MIELSFLLTQFVIYSKHVVRPRFTFWMHFRHFHENKKGWFVNIQFCPV